MTREVTRTGVDGPLEQGFLGKKKTSQVQEAQIPKRFGSDVDICSLSTLPYCVWGDKVPKRSAGRSRKVIGHLERSDKAEVEA